MRVNRHTYRPSTEAERRAELTARNTHRLIEYFARSVEHDLGQAQAAKRRRLHLAAAFVARRQGEMRA